MKVLKYALQTVALGCVGLILVLVLVAGGGRLIAQNAATQSGDANGSGSVDIGDVVYLLSYLFHGGPEPVALAGPTPVATSPLPAPQDIVFVESSDVGGAVVVQATETHVAYSVPSDSWFVMTSLQFSATAVSASGCSLSTSLAHDLYELESSGVEELVIHAGGLQWERATGVVFGPGSEIRFRDPSTLCDASVRYQINGYLVLATP